MRDLQSNTMNTFLINPNQVSLALIFIFCEKVENQTARYSFIINIESKRHD